MKQMTMTIEVPFASEAAARKALSALEGELSFQGRAKASLSLRKDIVLIMITADDVASLHATAGSYLRALKVVTAVHIHAK